MSKEIKLKYWCNSCEKFIEPKDVSIDIHKTNENELLFSHHGNHLLSSLQYTGLKDKNGIEIYEGDIVKRKDKSIDFEANYEIQFRGDGFILVDGILDEGIKKNIGKYEIEVIGNIYENKELLKL